MAKRILTIILLIILVISIMFVAGCPQDKEEKDKKEKAEAKKGGTFSFYIDEPDYIDPYNAQESEGVFVVSAIFDSLVDFDSLTSEIKPKVAESWETNDDATVWTFTLRKGTKFHNGQEVKAQDFKYAWGRIANGKHDPPSEIAYHLASIKGFQAMQDGNATELEGVKAIDDYTLEVTLEETFADFVYVTGHPALAPVPKEEVEKDEKAFMEMPIGNGPFKVSEPWKHDQYVKVERFDDYYGEKALLDGVEFKIFKDEEAAFLEFENGNLDFTSIPSGQIQTTIDKYGEGKYKADKDEQVLLGPELSTYYIWLNMEDENLKNLDLRKAISLALDRASYAKTIWENTREPATGVIPPGVVGYQKDAWAYSRYDVEEAKKFLEKAGFPNGEGLKELTLGYDTGGGHEDVMQAIQADLKKIGINVKLVGFEWAQWLDILDAGDYDLGRLGWVADYPIMDNFLNPMFQSKSSDNYANYNNSEFDNKIIEARKTTDEDERVEMYQDLEKVVGEDVPLIPIVNYRHRHVVSERVRDFILSPMYLHNLDEVWIDE